APRARQTDSVRLCSEHERGDQCSPEDASPDRPYTGRGLRHRGTGSPSPPAKGRAQRDRAEVGACACRCHGEGHGSGDRKRAQAKKIRLLIVDDTEEARVFLRSLLEMNGYICAPAANAAEARELLQQQAFELALCDVNMPGESGLSLVRHILAKHPDTATIMV